MGFGGEFRCVERRRVAVPPTPFKEHTGIDQFRSVADFYNFVLIASGIRGGGRPDGRLFIDRLHLAVEAFFMTTAQQHLSLIRATEEHRPALEQLWTMFRHDMSAFTGTLPDEHGRFRQERLDNALTETGWAAYLLQLDRFPIGFAVVRNLDEAEHVVSSFFLVNAARRHGHGRTAVRLITEQHAGQWAVAFQDRNTVAARFWTAVASQLDARARVEHCAVPGRPDLPADAWVRFTAR